MWMVTPKPQAHQNSNNWGRANVSQICVQGKKGKKQLKMILGYHFTIVNEYMDSCFFGI